MDPRVHEHPNQPLYEELVKSRSNERDSPSSDGNQVTIMHLTHHAVERPLEI